MDGSSEDAAGGVGGRRERIDALADSVLAVTASSGVQPTLQQIVRAAVDLVGARYGALGVLGEGGMLDQFVPVGIGDDVRALIGHPPTGHGVLGVPVEDQGVLRLTEVSRHAASVGFPPGHPPMRGLLAVPIRARGRAFGRLYLSEKAGGADFTDDDEVVVGALAVAAGAAIDNAYVYERGLRRERWLEATGGVTAELLRGSETKKALAVIAARARELVGADYTFIAVPPTAEAAPWEITDLTVAACAGTAADSITGRIIPVSGSTTGAVFTDHLPRRVDVLHFNLARGTTEQFGPAVVVPFVTGGSLSGVLVGARSPSSDAFDEDALRMLDTFADHAGQALRDADTQKTRNELKLLADRDRIARDMHDHVLQRLYVVGLALQRTRQRSTQPEIATRIADHKHRLQDIIHDIRAVIYELSPDPAAAPPLRATLRAVITELTADAALRASLRMSGPLDIVPPDLAQHAEAVVREAVSNAVRHSRATELTVSITVGDHLVIDIDDDGTGIPDTARRSGLRNMQVRAQQVGGSCTIGPGRIRGTHVTWTAPLHNRR